MFIKFIILLALILCLWGCSSSERVLSDKNSSTDMGISYGELNIRTSGQSVAVFLKNGEQTEATDFCVLADSTSFVNKTDERRCVIATSEIRSIELTLRVNGMLEGVFPGATIGAVLFAALAETDENGLWGIWLRSIAGTGALRGAIVGCVAGVLIGLSRGHVDRYEFSQDSTASITLRQSTIFSRLSRQQSIFLAP